MIKISDTLIDRDKYVVYVVGSISNDPNYKEKFQEAYNYLKSLGYTKIIIPTCVPDTLPYSRYAPISIGFVQASDIVYVLKDWKKSKGAKAEVAYAEMSGRAVFYENI